MLSPRVVVGSWCLSPRNEYNARWGLWQVIITLLSTLFDAVCYEFGDRAWYHGVGDGIRNVPLKMREDNNCDTKLSLDWCVMSWGQLNTFSLCVLLLMSRNSHKCKVYIFFRNFYWSLNDFKGLQSYVYI